MIHLSTSLKYYKRPEIQQAIVDCAANKEVAIKYGDNGYGKRPDSLKYPADVLEFAKKGATSFHCSEELWTNPLSISTMMKKQDVEELRFGWDLVLDVDCPILDYSSIAADLIIQALKHSGIETLSIKFSGNHGWHIAVPFEAFPDSVHGKPTKELFPDGPKRIALYLREKIRQPLADRLLMMNTIDKIAAGIGKSVQDVVKKGVFDPFAVLDIDTILISPRHLYRMPYSLNEKSGLASVVVDPKKILSFDKKMAEPDGVVVQGKFLDRKKARKGEAQNLMDEAFYMKVKAEESTSLKKLMQAKRENWTSKDGEDREFEFVSKVPEQYFPPCIQAILKGLADGKKRSLFILVNFLDSCGYSSDEIEKILADWNKKNKEPLREVNIVGHLRYHKNAKKKVPPPNCDNEAYYKAIGVCCPDNFCARIKNPVSYATRKVKLTNITNKDK
jgi:DNA primase catalytic subunit